ncbi:hypothetical protein KEM55_006781 [Ascosphaera atra]|nr:hypothetical protein KEM55_006781 [Ascosphaera atra]
MPIKALLFDIGGVCVLSPMLAIRTYEQTHSLPPGWINYAIQSNTPTGAWHRLERGQLRVGPEFYAQFEADFQRADLWAAYLKKIGREGAGSVPVPVINGEELFREMMEVARTLDPDMFPVLKALKESGRRLR